jgi:4,5-DOPA dioxygenase extradiol
MRDRMTSPANPLRLSRRELLRLGAGGAMSLVAEGAVAGSGPKAKSPSGTERMPVVFAAHGNPMFMDDAMFMDELNRWASALPRPKAVLMVSAHWEARPCTLGATAPVPLVYDFTGFPARYYQVTYPAPGAPWLAERVRALLQAAGEPVAHAPRRGLDHGAYVPMICMYPKADVPVLQLSLPTLDAPTLFRLGLALGPLRDEGVLVMGSGFLTHNLRTVDWGDHPTTPAWAKEFDDWARDAIVRRDFDALMDFQARAPAARLALPTVEHYVPLLVAAGASARQTEAVAFPITGFAFGTFTKRSVQFG